MLRPGSYLGFDFGTKRIGIAVGQSITLQARPLITLAAQKGNPPWDKLDDIIEEWLPQGLVVGLALQPDQTPSTTSLKAQKLAAQLAARYQLRVYTIDEHLTSVAAQMMIKERSYPAKPYDVDAVAAAIILESWFNQEMRTLHASI
jgi:putative Holliday junction resolvase